MNKDNKLNPGVIEQMVRVVYGEACGEPFLGKKGVADAIQNRLVHPGYSNLESGGIFDPHQFNTLNYQSHTNNYEKDKSSDSKTYNECKEAVLSSFDRSNDSVSGATDFDSSKNSSSLQSNKYWDSKFTTQIGNHIFHEKVAKKK